MWYAVVARAAQKKRREAMPDKVFMVSGSVAHVLCHGSSPNSNDKAACGRSPWPELWRGTGNQEERDKVKSMPVCVGCKAVLARWARGQI